MATLLATAVLCGNQSNAFGGDPAPQRPTGPALDPTSEWLWTHMDGELGTKTLTHLSRYLVDLGLLDRREPGGRHYEREVDVAPGVTFPARHAAEDQSLSDVIEFGKPSREEPLQIGTHLRLFAEESVKPRIQHMPPVEGIEIRAACPLHVGYAYFREAGQHF